MPEAGGYGNSAGPAVRPTIMSTLHRTVALLVTAVLAAAACGDGAASPEPPTGTSPSFDGAWVLAAGTLDGADLALDSRYRVTLTIEGDQVSGTAACNHYGGTAVLAGGGFRVGGLGMTAMGCEPPVMDLEQAYTAALMRVASAERTADLLTLSGDGVSLTFTLLPPVPTADLIGVTWVLDTLIDGETASSTVAGAGPAILRLDPDGTLEAGTGCRGFSGEYTVSGDTVWFTTFGQDGDAECPPGMAAQDGHVVTVLGDGFTAAIEGDLLTLTSTGGLGLVYRAQG